MKLNVWRRWLRGPLRPVRCELSRGRACSLFAVDGPLLLRVVYGVVWMTGDGLAGDIVLRQGEALRVAHGAHVVIQAMRDARVDWTLALDQRGASRDRTSRGRWTMASAPAASNSDSGRNPQVSPTANIPAARAVSMSVAVSPR